jgi:hypothetical protein
MNEGLARIALARVHWYRQWLPRWVLPVLAFFIAAWPLGAPWGTFAGVLLLALTFGPDVPRMYRFHQRTRSFGSRSGRGVVLRYCKSLGGRLDLDDHVRTWSEARELAARRLASIYRAA